MNKNAKKAIIGTLIGGLSLLVLAGIILIVVGIIQQWDIVGALTSPVAFLWYGLIAVFALFLSGFLFDYLVNRRY